MSAGIIGGGSRRVDGTLDFTWGGGSDARYEDFTSTTELVDWLKAKGFPAVDFQLDEPDADGDVDFRVVDVIDLATKSEVWTLAKEQAASAKTMLVAAVANASRSGVSEYEIARQCRVTRQTVRNWLGKG